MKYIYYFLILTTCVSCHRIHEGTVTNKYVIPAHTYNYTTLVFVGKTPIITWHTGYAPDEYILTVTKIQEMDTISEDFSVDAETYSCKSTGDHFNDTVPCKTFEPK